MCCQYLTTSVNKYGVFITLSGRLEGVFAALWFHSLDPEMSLDKLRYLVLLKPHPFADTVEGKALISPLKDRIDSYP